MAKSQLSPDVDWNIRLLNQVGMTDAILQDTYLTVQLGQYHRKELGLSFQNPYQEEGLHDL